MILVCGELNVEFQGPIHFVFQLLLEVTDVGPPAQSPGAAKVSKLGKLRQRLVEVLWFAVVNLRLFGQSRKLLLLIVGDVGALGRLREDDFELAEERLLVEVEQTQRFVAAQHCDPVLMHKHDSDGIVALLNESVSKQEHLEFEASDHAPDQSFRRSEPRVQVVEKVVEKLVVFF